MFGYTFTSFLYIFNHFTCFEVVFLLRLYLFVLPLLGLVMILLIFFVILHSFGVIF